MDDQRVLRRMRGQYGIITRAQALADGMTKAQIDHCVRTGGWVREARGVYRHAAAAPTPMSRLLAACMAHNGLASHRSAAALHGIEGFKLDRVELTVASGKRPSMAGVRLHQSTMLSLAEPTDRQGVPCTGRARTVVDLASVVTHKRLERVIDAVLRDGLLRPSDLYGALATHARRGCQGYPGLRAVLDDRLGDDPVPLSEWSRMVEDLLVGSGLSRPRLEYRICDDAGALLAQVDLAYPAHRVAIELDSVRYHLNRESFVSDPRRRNRLTVAGWKVLSFTWQDYVKCPSALCDAVAAACKSPVHS